MKNVLEYLERSAQSRPDKPAFNDEAAGVRLTFAEMLRLCRSTGSALAEHVSPGEPVAVFMDKGTKALTAFWGAVYAGGFYCMFSPELPAPRLQAMYSVLSPACVVTDSEHENSARTLFPDAEVRLIEALSSSSCNSGLLLDIRARAIDTDALYVNFTSGSTGLPKGVVVSHRSVIDFIEVFTGLFGITDDDIIGNQAPFDFDVSVKDMYSALMVGATLDIIPKNLFSRPSELVEHLYRHKVTTLIWAVSAICLISSLHGLDYRTPDSIKRVLFSGEVMPKKHLDAWRRSLPRAMFVNLYGPTEITCNCTYHILHPDKGYEDGIPIGIPFPNEDVFLLSENEERITSPSCIGEICVRGSALALGYYRDSASTDAVFTQNPLNARYPERIYRTGDLGYYSEGGELYFSGRQDFQIKHMGHRIELGEIERAAESLDGVSRCCCLYDIERSRICAYYTGSLPPRELRGLLRAALPAYMVPSNAIHIDAFPLGKNGKIDRKRLLEGG